MRPPSALPEGLFRSFFTYLSSNTAAPRLLSPIFQTILAGPLAETLRPAHIDRVVGSQDSDRAALPKDSHPKENAPNIERETRGRTCSRTCSCLSLAWRRKRP